MRAFKTTLIALLAYVGGACDGGGARAPGPPTVENQIRNQEAQAGGDAISIDLRPVFTAPSGTTLSYAASSSNTAVATTQLESATLTVTPKEGGEAEITVTARNEDGQAQDVFTVSVFANPPSRPEKSDSR